MVAIKENPYKEKEKSKPEYEALPLMHETISRLEQRVRPAPKEQLKREGVYGRVDSRTGEGVYAEGMPGVQQHEIAHSIFGFDGSPRGEYNADIWMLYKEGKPENVRGPFYQPPLN